MELNGSSLKTRDVDHRADQVDVPSALFLISRILTRARKEVLIPVVCLKRLRKTELRTKLYICPSILLYLVHRKSPAI